MMNDDHVHSIIVLDDFTISVDMMNDDHVHSIIALDDFTISAGQWPAKL
jgi:hypothetical protein